MDFILTAHLELTRILVKTSIEVLTGPVMAAQRKDSVHKARAHAVSEELRVRRAAELDFPEDTSWEDMGFALSVPSTRTTRHSSRRRKIATAA